MRKYQKYYACCVTKKQKQNKNKQKTSKMNLYGKI